MELCTSTVNGNLGLKENIIQQNPTWSLSGRRKEERVQRKSLSAIASQAEEAEQLQADLEAPVVLFCKEIPHPICSARVRAGNISTGTGT